MNETQSTIHPASKLECEEYFRQNVGAVRQWIQTRCYATARRSGGNTYQLKHLMHQETRLDVTEAEFTSVALAEGYDIVTPRRPKYIDLSGGSAVYNVLNMRVQRTPPAPEPKNQLQEMFASYQKDWDERNSKKEKLE